MFRQTVEVSFYVSIHLWHIHCGSIQAQLWFRIWTSSVCITLYISNWDIFAIFYMIKKFWISKECNISQFYRISCYVIVIHFPWQSWLLSWDKSYFLTSVLIKIVSLITTRAPNLWVNDLILIEDFKFSIGGVILQQSPESFFMFSL